MKWSLKSLLTLEFLIGLPMWKNSYIWSPVSVVGNNQEFLLHHLGWRVLIHYMVFFSNISSDTHLYTPWDLEQSSSLMSRNVNVQFWEKSGLISVSKYKSPFFFNNIKLGLAFFLVFVFGLSSLLLLLPLWGSVHLREHFMNFIVHISRHKWDWSLR